LTRRNDDGKTIEERYSLHGIAIKKKDYIKYMRIAEKFTKALKCKFRHRILLKLRETDLFEEKYLCNIVANYVI
jgi:hypothetical protein